MQVLMFSKTLASRTVDQAVDIIAEMGFDGVDFTVRYDPGGTRGHVLPENVVQDLPEAILVLKGKGLDVPMITTAITNSSEPYAENVFRTAAECGVK